MVIKTHFKFAILKIDFVKTNSQCVEMFKFLESVGFNVFDSVEA